MCFIKLFIPYIISKISPPNAFDKILIISLALHRVLYAITADKVNENKVCTGLTVITQTKK